MNFIFTQPREYLMLTQPVLYCTLSVILETHASAGFVGYMYHVFFACYPLIPLSVPPFINFASLPRFLVPIRSRQDEGGVQSLYAMWRAVGLVGSSADGRIRCGVRTDHDDVRKSDCLLLPSPALTCGVFRTPKSANFGG